MIGRPRAYHIVGHAKLRNPQHAILHNMPTCPWMDLGMRPISLLRASNTTSSNDSTTTTTTNNNNNDENNNNHHHNDYHHNNHHNHANTNDDDNYDYYC